MNTGLWVLLWVIVALVIMGILLWAANRKPVEKSQESLIDVDALARYPHQNPLDYLADIYPVTGEYPKPLTGIQKEEEAKRAIEEFAAGSTAVPFEHPGYRESNPAPRKPLLSEFAKTTLKIGEAKSRLSSVKSKTPVAKKAPAKKAAKPIVKKRATKRATNKA
jgi:hypothetical protein